MIWALEVGIRGFAQDVTLPGIRQGITLSRNEYITSGPNGNAEPKVQLRIATINGGIVGVAASLDLMWRDLAVYRCDCMSRPPASARCDRCGLQDQCARGPSDTVYANRGHQRGR